MNMDSARISTLTLAALMAALALCACNTDYQTKAVEKAREYALDNLKDIPETQRDYIRYTDPEFLDQVIFLNGSKPTSRNNYMHTCIVWKVPGMTEKVVVSGTGDRMMREWNPNRVLLKNFPVIDPRRKEARYKATSYVMDRMLYLSDNERNRVRFTAPEILKTSFDVPYEDEADKKKAAQKPLSRWEQYLRSIERKRVPEQFSLVWKGDKDGQRIVVCGFSSETMKDWTPRSGMLVQESDLKTHIVAEAPEDDVAPSVDAEKSVPAERKAD